MSLARLRSERDMHRWEKRYLCWNHGNWTKLDRVLRRAERHAAKAELKAGDE